MEGLVTCSEEQRADTAEEELLQLMQKPALLTAGQLRLLGNSLDRHLASQNGQTVAMALAEKLLRVRLRSGKLEHLRANAMQMAFEERRGQKNIVLKARQLGMSTWAAARFFLRTITQPGTLTLEVMHSQEAAEDLFRIVRRFMNQLPDDLLKGPLKTSRATVRQVIFPALEAQLRVVTAGDRNAGRGLTVQNLHCSELARWPGDAAETLAGLRAALAPGAEQILESTPDGVGGCFYDEWQKANETGLVRHFFPWWMEQHYVAEPAEASTLSGEEKALCERHGLSLEQIGYRRQIRAEFRGLARQEYAEDEEACFRSSGDPVFEIDAIEKRLREAPASTEQRRNGELEIWWPAAGRKQYLVAVDPAGGGSEGDYSALQVLEMETCWQCAEFAGHVGGLELAQLAVDLAREYNQAWLVIERNNHGSGVLALAESVCHYERIYKDNGQAGWLTSSLSRPVMLGELDAALVASPEIFKSRKLLSECRTFVRLPNGKTGARAGAYDDRVMAMAIGLAARKELLQGRRRHGCAHCGSAETKR